MDGSNNIDNPGGLINFEKQLDTDLMISETISIYGEALRD